MDMTESKSKVLGALVLIAFLSSMPKSSSDQPGRHLLAQDHHQGHGEGGVQPIPFAYCKPFLEKLSLNEQHQLRESYQEYHGAYSRYMRAARNHEAFVKGPATWLQDESQRQAWNITYLLGQNLDDLTREMNDAQTVMKNMEQRIKAQLQRLETQGSIPHDTPMDDLSPCIMRKIYPSRFPDQPDVSLLLRIRGAPSDAGDWPTATNSTTEPPTGKGPEAVFAFIQRATACRSVAPTELIVVLSGEAAAAQTTTWAWQSWQSDGFVVPIVDMIDREAHVLNRMASVARGSVLVALRTDRNGVEDLLVGKDCSWLQRIVTLYHRIPQLGAMTHGRFSFSHPASADGAQRLLGSAAGSSGGGPKHDNQFFKEKVTSVPFQYVLYGDYMPMSFRRSALEEVGGFDEDLPQGDGECSNVLRHDLTLRLWKSGWRVGAHDAGLLQRPAADPAAVNAASASDPAMCPAPVAKLASELFEARHVPASATSPTPVEILSARVRDLNMQQLEPLAPNALEPCPMPQGCKA